MVGTQGVVKVMLDEFESNFGKGGIRTLEGILLPWIVSTDLVSTAHPPFPVWRIVLYRAYLIKCLLCVFIMRGQETEARERLFRMVLQLRRG